MKKTILPFLWLMLVFAFFNACKKADIQFGSEFLSENVASISRIDTFSVDVSTVLLDSFATNNTTTANIGGYTDKYLGRIDNKYFAELATPYYDNNLYTNAKFDSLVLILSPNRQFYGDSTATLPIVVEELAENITLPENSSKLFSNDEFAVNDLNNIGEANIQFLKPSISENKVVIKLSNTVGQAWLTKLKNSADVDFKTDAAFAKYFKGICISSKQSSKIIAGFSTDSLKIRLHYTKPDVVAQSKYVDFTVRDKSKQFNNIKINRAGTLLANVGKKKEINSTETNNLAFIQSATGTVAKLQFNSIRELLKVPHYAKMIKATLQIKPIVGSFNFNYYLPPYLRISNTNYDYIIGESIGAYASDGSMQPQYGNLSIDYYKNEDTRYQYDVTALLKSFLDNPETSEAKYGMLVSAPSPFFENNFARAIIGNKFNLKNGVSLIVHYITVK